MKIPKFFNFMGKRYTVALEDLSECEKWGRTDFTRQHISIELRLAKESQEQTFLHELLHVVIYEMGLDKSLKLSEEFEEKLVNSLSNGLFAMRSVINDPATRRRTND